MTPMNAEMYTVARMQMQNAACANNITANTAPGVLEWLLFGVVITVVCIAIFIVIFESMKHIVPDVLRLIDRWLDE